MRAIVPALTMLLLGAGPALATSTVDCNFHDASLKLELEATASSGMGQGIERLSGKLEVLLKGAPEDQRRLDLGREHLTQHWLHGSELKLRIYRERPATAPHGYVEVVVETQRAGRDEPEFRGSYILTVHHLPSETATEGKTLTARGRAACTVG